MRPVREYMLDETPLCLSQETRGDNLFFSGGFRSNLTLFDIRMSKEVLKFDFKSEAVTCMKESVFEVESIFLGERGGKVRIFDLRKRRTRLEWTAHEGMTNLSRPNGIVRVFEESSGQLVTAGSNDRRLACWPV